MAIALRDAVEEVLDKRRIKDTIHYLVKWAGWPSEYNSYEPAAHLANAPRAIASFEQKLEQKRKRKNKENDGEPPAKRARRFPV